MQPAKSTPSAAARTGVNYAGSWLVLLPSLLLSFTHQLERELTDTAKTDGRLFVQAAPFQQPSDSTGVSRLIM